MRPKYRLLGVLMFGFVLALAGCAAHHRAEVAKQAQVDLVGYTKAQILSCAGAPVRSDRAQDIEVLTYVAGGDSTGAVVGVAQSSVGVGVVGSHKRYCEVTFVLRGGVVEKVNYAGRTGGAATKGEQCAVVVEGCLKPQ
jgi:hypothetical protein